MSKFKYQAELYIITREQVDHKGHPVDIPIERINIPVHSFEVEGGANRKIDLTSASETSISSEFEQARIYTNFIFYIPPTKDFMVVKLINLSSGKNSQLFEFTFVVSTLSNGKVIQTLRMTAEMASFRESPSPIGSTPPLLMAKVRLVSPKLLYGHFEPKMRRLIHTEI
jgi:hypothetical protein